MSSAPLPTATLDPRWYVDPAHYDREVERIFRREWLCVAREDQVARPGHYLAFDLLGEPLVAVRGHDGVLRVLSRVCRHRSMAVVERGAGRRRSFQCPYHLWTYALDGHLVGAPEMEHTAGFDRDACRLPSLRVEIWEGFVFASFDPDAAPLAPRLAGLQRAIAPYRPAAMRTTEPLDYQHDWNWKVMVENFVESYHHAGVHPDTLQPMVPASGTFAEDAASDAYAVLHNPTQQRTPLPAVFPPTPGLADAQRAEFVVGAVFPFLLFSVQHDALIWYRLEPQAVDRFALSIHLCVPPEAVDAPDHAERVAGVKQFLDAVHQQDIATCQGVQRGLRSRYAAVGPLSHLEKAIAQLARFVLARVGAP
jgi:phenylpropionate dioxygenase-like ring-hydroxylating dioxygenase large terminal subunit